MTRVLCVVGILALAFTTVNVTRFATSRDVPLPIAVLLDPIIGTALAGVLYVDARLAAWGITPPAWSTTLRWSAGSTAALMNTWESLWPDGQIGWPGHADPAAVLLHLIPALLLIALTETIAAYRRTITNLLDQTTPTDPTNPTRPTEPADRTEPTAPAHPGTAPASRSATDRADRELTIGATLPACSSPQNASGPTPPCGQADRPGAADPALTRPNAADVAPRSPCTEPDRPPPGIRAADADLWPHALALDKTVRAATGRPASIWRLRNELHLGPKRARRIHHQLHHHNTDRPPPIE
ncbi:MULTISPECIES: extensin [unclassified Streptomyces]|uniref:extensin n=1 Tax=unclassified Streptomyces TaxID=2593676 RepID=UPI001925C0A5|nr:MULTISPECIES: extensin [unclassified Streptomyces]